MQITDDTIELRIPRTGGSALNVPRIEYSSPTERLAIPLDKLPVGGIFTIGRIGQFRPPHPTRRGADDFVSREAITVERTSSGVYSVVVRSTNGFSFNAEDPDPKDINKGAWSQTMHTGDSITLPSENGHYHLFTFHVGSPSFPGVPNLVSVLPTKVLRQSAHAPYTFCEAERFYATALFAYIVGNHSTGMDPNWYPNLGTIADMRFWYEKSINRSVAARDPKTGSWVTGSGITKKGSGTISKAIRNLHEAVAEKCHAPFVERKGQNHSVPLIGLIEKYDWLRSQIDDDLACTLSRQFPASA